MEKVPEISKSDCHKVISKKLGTEDFTVLNFQQIAFTEVNGYLGEHSTLIIEIDQNGLTENFKFFVKSLPTILSQRNFLLEINGFVKENHFFTKYCPLLKQHSIDILDDAVPACYFTNEEILIFEDLKSKGYETLLSRVPMKINCVKAALVAAAKLHASGLIIEEIQSIRLTDDFGVELRESFHAGTKSTEGALSSCKHGIRALIDMTHNDDMKISKDLFKEKAIEGLDLLKKFAKPTAKFRNTICHGDLWTKNFMFKFEEDSSVKCVIVDFQTYRYGPPAQDVITLIHLVTDRDMRNRHMDELLLFYYEELNRNLDKFGFKDLITKSEFFDGCGYFKRFALSQTLMHFQIVVMSDQVADELFSDGEKARFVLFENKYDFIVSTCLRDPVFKRMNFEAIADLREFHEDQLL